MILDICYCGTPCPQTDCKRQLKLENEEIQYYTLSLLDEENPDKTHKDCKYKLI